MLEVTSQVCWKCINRISGDESDKVNQHATEADEKEVLLKFDNFSDIMTATTQ